MQDSKFWRFAAVLMIAAALYVGHGLHDGGMTGAPSLVNTARAGGVALAFDGPAVFTASADGKTLFTWHRDAGGTVKYAGQVSVGNGEVKAQ